MPDQAPLDLSELPNMPKLGTRSKDIDRYYSSQEAASNKARLEVLKDREREELMGEGDQFEYMNKISWPKTELKKGYKIKKLFSYNEDDETKLIWCPGVVTKVISKGDKEIIASIKWDRDYIGIGEADVSKEKLNKNKWNPDKPRAGAWRQDLREKRLIIE